MEREKRLFMGTILYLFKIYDSIFSTFFQKFFFFWIFCKIKIVFYIFKCVFLKKLLRIIFYIFYLNI